MASVSNYVLDAALAKLDAEANALHLCSQEPTTYAEAITTYSLASKSGIAVGSPENHSPSGRKVTVAAIDDGLVNSSGTATHFAIVDTVNTRLLVTGALSASQALTLGNGFQLPAFYVAIPGPA